MIPHPHRQKGGAPQIKRRILPFPGARQSGERGPFGSYGADEDQADEDALDDDQADEPVSAIPDTDR